jgi:hypothetical protein
MGIKASTLVYTIIDALSFMISGSTNDLETKKTNGVIKSLQDSDGLDIHIGLTVEIKKRPFLINFIEEIINTRHTKYKISMAKRTKSSLFVLPMLSGERHLYLWNTLLLNCFIGSGKDKNCIMLLYRFSKSSEFLKFEQALSKFSTFKRKEDPESEYVMFVFNVPKAHLRNYRNFIKGQYSKFTLKYKNNILKFHGIDQTSEIGQILFKDENRKKALEKRLKATLPEDSELMSIINPEEEVFNIKNYKLKKLI